MVKLKVYVRVVSESAYSTDAATAAARKFLVVVRDPAEWYIGTLAREAQRTYQRLYKHELGKVKYLKDGDDNDLDPEQLVSDVFINEGKAARDGLDQEAVIKIIQEQGHAVRAGSVVPDLTPTHYSRPPTSTTTALSSSLGKRSHGATGASPRAIAEKKTKLVEIPESQELVDSVERSPELIQDTQHEQADDDVFDDAKEYPLATATERTRPASGTTQPSQTPFNHVLTNDTAGVKSPVPQTSSSASKFKTGNKRDVYAYPESDIEDSQMSSTQAKGLTNGVKPTQAAELTSSQPKPSQNAVTAFNAEEALFPTDVDQAVPARTQKSPQATRSTPRKGVTVASDDDSTESGSGDSGDEPAQAKNVKSRHPPEPHPGKGGSGQQSVNQRATDVVSKEGGKATSQKRKRDEANDFVNGSTDNDNGQNKASQQPTSSLSTTQTRKPRKRASASNDHQLKPTLTASPSRRTSGVVSELDSPGEQLSQSLWDSAKGQRLAHGVQTALSRKPLSRKEQLMAQKHEEASQSASSSSPSTSSRPSSRDGPTIDQGLKKPLAKQSQSSEQAKVQQTPKATTQAKSGTKKIDKPAKPQSLKEKLADASSKVATKATKAIVGTSRERSNAASSDESGSDEEKGAALPSIEVTSGAQGTGAPSLPLPEWGAGSKEATTLPVGASPAFVVPVGMTEEEYIRLRAKHELTPQPPKVTPVNKKKSSTPAASAKPPVTPATKAGSKTTRTMEKAPEMAKTAAKKTVADESSSEEEEDSSSSNEPEQQAKDQPKEKKGVTPSTTKSPSRSVSTSKSKSKSPVEVRKEQPAKGLASNDKSAMPPPTPKSTAKRRESMNKQGTARSSSSVSTGESFQTSSESSDSPAPTKAKNAADSMKKPSQVPAKQVNVSIPASAKPVRPVIPEKRESGLQALRKRINSQAASPVPSSAASRVKKKPLPVPESSSSESESSSSSDDDDSADRPAAKRAQQPAAKGKARTPLATVEKRPDPTIRDPSPDDSSDESDDD